MANYSGSAVRSWTGNRSNEKLMSTKARDNADSLSATNEQKQYVGKGGKPSEPLGKKGRNF